MYGKCVKILLVEKNIPNRLDEYVLRCEYEALQYDEIVKKRE